MYTVLNKDTIEEDIIPYLPTAQRGFVPTVSLAEIINSILYKLKTGVQWHQLPVKALFEDKILSWQSVYHNYRKWCKAGALKSC